MQLVRPSHSLANENLGLWSEILNTSKIKRVI